MLAQSIRWVAGCEKKGEVGYKFISTSIRIRKEQTNLVPIELDENVRLAHLSVPGMDAPKLSDPIIDFKVHDRVNGLVKRAAAQFGFPELPAPPHSTLESRGAIYPTAPS